jgi:hypothetical protein
LGVDPKDPSATLAQIKQDPVAAAKTLQDFEAQHLDRLRDHQFEAAKASVQQQEAQTGSPQPAPQNVSSAAPAVVNPDLLKTDVNSALMGWVVIVGFFLSMVLLIGFADNVEKLKTGGELSLMIGALIAGFSNILGYYFGSSQGSAQKTAFLAASPAVNTGTTTNQPTGRPGTKPGP